MHHQITLHHDISQTAPAGQKNRKRKRSAFVQVNSFKLQQLPSGAIRLDDKWNVLEYRHDDNEDISFRQVKVGRNLFSCIPWAGVQGLRDLLKDAIHSEASTLHFDFSLSAHPVERSIHINVFAAGDNTVWLFFSDRTPPLL